jgi:hypothetical protein
MIRGKEGHPVVGSRFGNPEQRIEHGGGGASVFWLDYDGGFLHVREQGAVEALVSLRHNHQRSIRRSDERRTPAGVTQECVRPDHCAELLGSVVAADGPG